MKFKSYLRESRNTGESRYSELNEEVLKYIDKDELETAQEILDQIDKLRLHNTKVKYRGFTGAKRNNGFAEVLNKRSGFFGSVSTIARNVIKKLGIKYPTFVAQNKEKASVFGPVFVYVPGPGADHYQSWSVQDIVSDLPNDEEKYNYEIVKSYKKYDLNDCKSPGEIIVDTEKYYLVEYDKLIQSFKSKYFKPVKVKTYSDIYKALESFIEYQKWMIKNGYRPSFDQTLSDLQKTKDRSIKFKEEMYSKKNREKRIQTVIDDSTEQDWPIEITQIKQVHRQIKTDGIVYKITGKYKKTIKEIMKFYTDIKRRPGEMRPDLIDNFMSSKDKEIILY